MGAQWSQFFPPKPTYTEANLPTQNGKVFLITGGASGIGLELAKMLYRAHGKVYLAGRSEDKAQAAIQTITSAVPSSQGSLHFLGLDLSDLSTIKSSAQEFQSKESKLDVLFNNAGVSQPPLGTVSAQGIELQLATNCLGPFLLTRLLLPTLKAASAPRVVWTASQMVELSAPTGGLIMDEIETPPKDKTKNYTNSKTGNLFLGAELARRNPQVLSVSLNPGAASTNLFRHTPHLKYLAYPLMYSANMAAHTVLFAGTSPDVSIERNNCGYIIPFGRVSTNLRQDLKDATVPTEEGGTGRAKEFWEWCAQKTADYA